MGKPSKNVSREIVPRKGLDFGLTSEDIPRFWLDGDPFKTRFFDAMSLLFPYGERFFIECVRDFREQITDPELQAQVKDFVFQEAQHGRAHMEFNDRVERQGVRVTRITDQQQTILGWFRKHFPKKYTLAQTAAAEHMTALMAHSMIADRELMARADPRLRALYTWHAVEEIEHKAVAFDVLTKVAKAGYFTRVLAMIDITFNFPFHTFLIMRHMFKVDGFSRKERRKMWLKGLVWLYGPRGIFLRTLPHYIQYYRPGYHPWDEGETEDFALWRDAYDRHQGNPVEATNSFVAALS